MIIGNKTQVGIAVPQTFLGGPVDPSIIEGNLRLVEALGYDSVWVNDQAIGTIQHLDPFALLAYASAFTTRVWLGVSVIATPFRSPVAPAKASASLDHVCGGRPVDIRLLPPQDSTSNCTATELMSHLDISSMKLLGPVRNLEPLRDSVAKNRPVI